MWNVWFIFCVNTYETEIVLLNLMKLSFDKRYILCVERLQYYSFGRNRRNFWIHCSQSTIRDNHLLIYWVTCRSAGSGYGTVTKSQSRRGWRILPWEEKYISSAIRNICVRKKSHWRGLRPTVDLSTFLWLYDFLQTFRTQIITNINNKNWWIIRLRLYYCYNIYALNT